MLTPEQQRIARDLEQGSKDLPAKRMVYVQAGDIIELVTSIRHETERANTAEAALAALKAD